MQIKIRILFGATVVFLGVIRLDPFLVENVLAQLTETLGTNEDSL